MNFLKSTERENACNFATGECVFSIKEQMLEILATVKSVFATSSEDHRLLVVTCVGPVRVLALSCCFLHAFFTCQLNIKENSI